MKMKNLVLVSSLIAALNLIPTGRVTAQTFTTLHSFTASHTNASGFYTNSDGANPYAGLTAAGNSNVRYGTAANGGGSGGGTVFAVHTDGTAFTALHNFAWSDGANPQAELLVSGHTLYGTASGGGDGGGGTVFAINTDGTGFTTLHSFTRASDLNFACIDDTDCQFYGGVCATDPANGLQYCWRPNDGAYPVAGLILAGNTLYGTASQGGNGGLHAAGTVFAVNTDGTGFTNLHNFGSYDGADPVAGLILSGDTLYGTTAGGGSSGNGTVFAVNTDGTGFTILHSFTPEYILCLNGSCPSGYHCVSGICVPIPVYGCPGGCGPCAYCVCFSDRDGNNIICYCVGDGSVGPGCGPARARLIPTGGVTAQTFISINLDGANPMGDLVLSNNILYGTAAAGGSWGAGTVFAINTDGTGFSVLHSFTGGSDGNSPDGGLILSGNTLYSAAYAGGSLGLGTVFAVNTDGTGFTNLYSFTGGSDGANPIGGLILSSNTLYGATRNGGSSGNGTAFSLPLPPLPPVAHCKHVTVAAGANCSADAAVDDGSFSPNAGDTITLVQSPAAPYPLGDTSVTLIVTNSSGLSNSCMATVTIVDTTPPVVACPGNIVTDAASPAGAVVSFSPAASDDCSLAGLTSSPTSGSTFGIGDTIVNCTATDAAGNQAICTFTVHVNGAAEQVNNLIAQVQRLGLPSGTANSLSVKLQGAASALDRGNSEAACGNLGAFLNEVNAQTGRKLTSAQADVLTAEATRIRAVLGCP